MAAAVPFYCLSAILLEDGTAQLYPATRRKRNERIGQLELKEKVTDSFLKTVSAFANGEGGLILIRDSSVTVRLPVADLAFSLTTDQEKVVSCLEEHPSISRRELENHAGFGRTRLSAILSDLRAKQRIVQLSDGRSARYRVASPMDLHSFEEEHYRLKKSITGSWKRRKKRRISAEKRRRNDVQGNET